MSNAPFRVSLKALALMAFVVLMAACSSTKYIPDGSFLLDEVKIKTDNKDVKPAELALYLRQSPNSRWFNLFRTQLYVYNWAGRDSTKWMNRMLRRLGDEPVIFNADDAERSRVEIAKAVRNMGYLGARVTRTSLVDGKKLTLVYDVKTGRPYVVRSIRREVGDSLVARYMEADSASTLLHEGMTMNVNVLDQERTRINSLLRQHGYYRFNKDYITYTADTVRGTYNVDLTLRVAPAQEGDSVVAHRQYTVDRILFVTDHDVTQSSALSAVEVDSFVDYHGHRIYYKDKLRLRPRVLTDALTFGSGDLYNEKAVGRTLANFGRFQALKYTNIRFFETQHGDTTLLDAYVLLTRSKPQSVSFQHRNLFRGSELLSIRLRGAYEAVSGLQGNYRNEDYTEMSAEATLNFPRFLFPFLSPGFVRKIRASTEFGLQYSYQFRPEFTRIVATANWSYKWGSLRRSGLQHRIDLLDVSYLYMPWISEDFQEQYLEQDENYILKYNYEDRFIVRTGYSLVYNSAGGSLPGNTLTGNAYSLRFNLESAGNFLYLLGRMGAMKKNADGEYTLLSIPFAQYVRLDLDFAKNLVIDPRNSVAFHIGGGVVVPYGNATVVPLEKRYFSGGANSVRGWSIRDLGPGTFPGDGNYLNRTGDVKLDANVEYRTRLFWKFNGAFFIDAGNIWTLRDYEDQPGGQFRLRSFLKEIAVSYGLGLRLDLDFFILRFDGGMKAVNPEAGAKRYPLTSPRFSRDFAFHFAVGYPF